MNDKEVKLDHIIKIIESGDLTMAKCLLLGNEDLFLSLDNKEFCMLIGDVYNYLLLQEDENQFLSKNGIWRIECSEVFTRCKMVLTIPSNVASYPEIVEGFIDMKYFHYPFSDYDYYVAGTRIAMIKLCL